MKRFCQPPKSVQAPPRPDDRYKVMQAQQPQQDRTNTDPVTIYFVFDLLEDTWADSAGNKVRWYSESDAILAYARCDELNALQRQMKQSGRVRKAFTPDWSKQDLKAIRIAFIFYRNWHFANNPEHHESKRLDRFIEDIDDAI